MRFHVLALPHTITRSDFSACAFTSKALKFCKMMHRRGHTVIHYGHKDSVVECTEHVTVTTNEDLEKAYGKYDWKKEFFRNNTADYAHKVFNERAAIEVGKRKQPHDFLLAFWGMGHLGVINAHPDLIAMEPGIGCFNKPVGKFNIFESYSVMSAIYGKYDMKPNFYDAVIPNYFDRDNFALGEGKGGYLLFVGRIIENKGVGIAMDIARILGKRLLVAGQGNLESIRNPIPDHVTYVGYVEPEQRKQLMMGAEALLAPSHYLEPFGGTAVEAMMCGTPIITTDWGGFTDFVVHGVTGYRCRTLDQFVWATRNACSLNRREIYDYANANFSLERIALKYEEVFGQIQNIYGKKGFYEVNPNRCELDWLREYLPCAIDDFKEIDPASIPYTE